MWLCLAQFVKVYVSHWQGKDLPIVRSNERPTEDWHLCIYAKNDDDTSDRRDSPPRRAKVWYFCAPHLLF
jgi:hypothetical protein